eukprot:1382345-Rhodomonas_salina.3
MTWVRWHGSGSAYGFEELTRLLRRDHAFRERVLRAVPGDPGTSRPAVQLFLTPSPQRASVMKCA